MCRAVTASTATAREGCDNGSGEKLYIQASTCVIPGEYVRNSPPRPNSVPPEIPLAALIASECEVLAPLSGCGKLLTTHSERLAKRLHSLARDSRARD